MSFDIDIQRRPWSRPSHKPVRRNVRDGAVTSTTRRRSTCIKHGTPWQAPCLHSAQSLLSSQSYNINLLHFSSRARIHSIYRRVRVLRGRLFTIQRAPVLYYIVTSSSIVLVRNHFSITAYERLVKSHKNSERKKEKQERKKEIIYGIKEDRRHKCINVIISICSCDSAYTSINIR